MHDTVEKVDKNEIYHQITPIENYYKGHENNFEEAHISMLEKDSVLIDENNKINDDDTMILKEYYSQLDDALEVIGNGKYQKLLLTLNLVASFMDACELSLSSLLYVEFKVEWHSSVEQLSLIGILSACGSLFGGIIMGWMSDRFGRKSILFPAICFTTILGILSSFATNTVQFALCRLFLSFFVQGLSISTTAMVMESTSVAVRAKYIVITGLAIPLAHVTMVSLAWLCFPTIGWRWVLRFVAFLSLPVFTLLLWIVESPRYLIAVGNFRQACYIVSRMASVNGKPCPVFFESADHINKSIENKSRCEILSKRDLFSIVPVGLVWGLISIAHGIHMFLPMELERNMGGKQTPYVVALVFAMAGTVGSLLNVYLVRQFRRLLMIRVNLLLAAIATLSLGIFREVHLYLVIIPVFFMHVSSVIISGTMFLYTGEIARTRVRASAVAFVFVFVRSGAMVASPLGSASYALPMFWNVFIFASIYMASLLLSFILRTETYQMQHFSEGF